MVKNLERGPVSIEMATSADPRWPFSVDNILDPAGAACEAAGVGDGATDRPNQTRGGESRR